MSEQKNVLILGASYAGLSSAHYFLRHVLPVLPDSKSYKVTLVNPSSHFFSRPAAPRAVATMKLMPPEKLFWDIAAGFKQYSADQFTFLEGTAVEMDPATKSVKIVLANKETTTVVYHALIIATGTRPVSPMLGMQTTHNVAKEAQAAFNAALPTAKSIVIAGGGPAGVETAGELGEELNGVAGMFTAKMTNPKVTITVVTAEKKLLPMLRPALALQAEKYLNKMGVNVVYNTRVESVTPNGAGELDTSTNSLDKVTQKATITLSDGKTLDADLYIPATGVKPNTSFLPSNLLTDRGYIEMDKTTLRVTAAGPLVYAIGDVGSYTRGGIMDIYDAVPVLLTNIKRDLLNPEGGAKGQDRPYKPNLKETHLVPVGRSKGVGAVFGWKLPSQMVWMIKGRDYFASMTPDLVGGNKWSKESKWAMDA
ncbi:FAD/NAD(P)-binding domain-containing protein [Tothia fuscella]|uniref:FAD/NAD(P)-binding domain-containing protein n=1 Tax=Tothia fuscella TaxID=1048955 RepID=A0A9P4NHF9_9PEZI|nr:FAD/NAD(P)-binding domain-containing protein [Tothia fuscella]